MFFGVRSVTYCSSSSPSLTRRCTQCFFIWTDTFLVKRVGIDAKWIMPIMSIGQVAEIGTMAVLGFFLNLGWKLTMTFGILGHFIRFGVFALMPDNAPLRDRHGCHPWRLLRLLLRHRLHLRGRVFPQVDAIHRPRHVQLPDLRHGAIRRQLVWPMTSSLLPCPRRGRSRSRSSPRQAAPSAAAILFIFFRVPTTSHELPADRKQGEGDDLGQTV
jgi:hypothetical protein